MSSTSSPIFSLPAPRSTSPFSLPSGLPRSASRTTDYGEDDDSEEERLDEILGGRSPRISSVTVQPRPSLPQKLYEPLLLGAGGDASPSLRHQHRVVMAIGVGSPILPSSPAGDCEISYSLDNPNYAINGMGSLNDRGLARADAEQFGRSPHIGPFIGSALDNVDALTLSGTPVEDSPQQLSPLHSHRHLVAAVFFLLSFNQGFMWLTFSPITERAMEYYDIHSSQVTLLFAWGPIITLALLSITARLASTTRAVRLQVLATAVLQLVACLLRVAPVVFNDALQSHALYFLHIGHILNAVAGVPLLVTITKFCSSWFGNDERLTAASLLLASSKLGAVVGFVLAPALVKQASDMPTLLYVQLGLATFAFLCAMAIAPSSRAPEQTEQAMLESKATLQTVLTTSPSLASPSTADPPVSFWRGVLWSLRNRNFVLLALSSGLLQGVALGWFGILSSVLPYSDTTCGWFSFSATLAGVFASLFVGSLARTHPWNRRLKTLLATFIIVAIGAAIWFLLSSESIFSDRPIISDFNEYTLGVSLGVLGFAIGATCPAATALAGELTYPLSESAGGLAINGVTSASAIIFLFVAPHFNHIGVTAIVAGTVLACALLLLPVRSAYTRLNEEHAIGGFASGLQSARRRSLLDEHTDRLQREFKRVMQEVDAGLSEGLGDDDDQPSVTQLHSDSD